MSKVKGVVGADQPVTATIFRRRAEREAPTRARAVLGFIRYVEENKRAKQLVPSKNLQGRVTPGGIKRRGVRGQHYHPAHKSRQEKHWAWMHPDEQEKHLQEVNRMMREHMRDHPQDGLIAGPLAVAAKYAVEQWGEDVWELFGPEHAAALYPYLVDKMGMVLHQFDRDEYLAWREECRQRALAPN